MISRSRERGDDRPALYESVSQSMSICGLFIYGIISLCNINSNCLSLDKSRGRRRCKSQTDWKWVLYEAGLRIGVASGRSVNISGTISSEERRGFNNNNILCNPSCATSDGCFCSAFLQAISGVLQGQTTQCCEGNRIASHRTCWDNCRRTQLQAPDPVEGSVR